MSRPARVALLVLLAAALATASPITVSYPGRTYQADETGQFSDSQVSHTGATFQEQGYHKLKPDGTYVLVKKGSYQYTSPEGVPVHITYYADDTGFHPTGDAIPVPPSPVQPVF